MEVKCLFDKLIGVKDLKPHPQNRNKHPKDQIERLAKILKYQGFRYPIKVSKRSGYVTSGHGRIEAAKFNNWPEVPVNFQDYESDEQEYADVQADNAIASWSELDTNQIDQDLKSIMQNLDRDLVGIKNLKEEEKQGQCDEDEVPEKVEPRTKLGDLYQLGEHRLLCGDSTKLEDVERLMDGQKADMVFTDPPYGVSYTEKNEFLNSIGGGHRLTNAIKNDSMRPEEMNEFWFQVLSNYYLITKEKSSYYICSPQGGDLMMMMMMSIIRAGWQLKHMLIWVKNNHVLGRCDYNYKHEPILYGWKKDGTHEFFGNGRCKTSVWDFNKPLKNDLHPTMKPVELCEEAILNSSNNGMKVVDLFGGSGSTLIACEKTNRKCFMMELDPHYCDVIVARWEKYTGLKAQRQTSDML